MKFAVSLAQTSLIVQGLIDFEPAPKEKESQLNPFFLTTSFEWTRFRVLNGIAARKILILFRFEWQDCFEKIAGISYISHACISDLCYLELIDLEYTPSTWWFSLFAMFMIWWGKTMNAPQAGNIDQAFGQGKSIPFFVFN